MTTTKRTTRFTITRKQWMDAIARFLTDRHLESQIITDWDEVVSNEGGMGGAFFDNVAETTDQPDSYPGRWFLSGQTDLSIYNEPQYLYSLLFGMTVVSGAVMSTIGKREVGNRVVDVGGSIFTAYKLLQRGVDYVDITNFDGYQLDFAVYASSLFHLNVVARHPTSIFPPDSVFVVSEYLEHFRDVDAELERLVEYRPIRIYESSSFCMPAYGHYIPIKIDGVDHTNPHSARKALYRKMLALGYEKERVPCFNRHFIVFNRIDPS